MGIIKNEEENRNENFVRCMNESRYDDVLPVKLQKAILSFLWNHGVAYINTDLDRIMMLMNSEDGCKEESNE